ncbi:Silicon efflux transporter LSI2-like protein [Drosera capensis]
MASAVLMVLGSLAFLVFWLSAVFPSCPFLPIGRTAGALLSALLMIACQVITTDEAFDSINLSILGLLFGTMVVAVYLETADMFEYLGKFLLWKSLGPMDLIFRLCLVSGFGSALFTNDTICFALSGFVLKISREQNLSPLPFLLALASSANIGSSATPIGNPQNLVISLKSKISFTNFLMGLLPATMLGVVVNALILLCFYWRSLKATNEYRDVTIEEGINGNEADHCTPLLNGFEEEQHALPILERMQEDQGSWKRVTWKACVYLIVVGMLISYLVGLNMSWTAIAAALALIVLDFKDAGPNLDKVSYSLLVFFSGMFITVEGFDETGIPGAFWSLMEPYSDIATVSGVVVLSIVIMVLSNLVSNVPTVLLLGSKIAASAAAISASEEKRAWLIIAWVSTVAGNLTLLGSAANLIVCEQARLSPRLSYTLSFTKHLVFGVPSTIIVTAIGLALIR